MCNIIYCLALPRSGHNGVMNWLLAQRGNYTDIFTNKKNRQEIVECDNILKIGGANVLDPRNKHLFSKYLQLENGLIIINNDEESGSISKDAYIIQQLTKRYGIIQKIIILRDWYNNLASMLKAARYTPTHKQKWLCHAREVMRETQYFDQFYCIIYNRWFTSVEYRKKICEDLGYTFTDEQINTISFVGSSFDGLSMQGKAQDMRVLERYKEYTDNDFFLQECRNEELVNLNYRIFGARYDSDYRRQWFYWSALKKGVKHTWYRLFGTK